MTEISEVLNWISPDTDRIDWLRIGTVIKAGGYGFEIFDYWSSGGSSYDESDTARAWRSIKESECHKIDNPDAYLVSIAKKSGYQPKGTIRTKSSEEIQREKAVRAAAQAKHDQEEKSKHARAATKAQSLWAASTPLDNNPYLSRKGVQAAGKLRQISTEQATKILGYRPKGRNDEYLEGELLIFPIGDETGITTCQLIDENGRKHLIAKGRKAGCWWSVEPIGDEVQIAEGMATALSGYEATGVNTVVAVDDSGILSVSKRLKELYPGLKITILGEPDKKTGATNRNHLKAQKAVGACLAMPTVGNDFNDMGAEKGLEAVREAIGNASLSQEIDGNRIDIDSLVTLNGREMTVYEAINNHQGKWVSHEQGSLYVNSFTLAKKGNGYQVSLNDLNGGYELLGDAKGLQGKILQSQQYKGIEQAKCAYSIIYSIFHRFGYSIQEPSKWLIDNFPYLERYYLNRLNRYIELGIRDRKLKPKDRFKIDSSINNIHLKREGKFLDWTPAIETMKNYKIVVMALEHESGKTSIGFKEAMNIKYGNKINLAVTLLQSLTAQLADKTNSTHYKDKEAKQYMGLARLATCLSSIAAPNIKRLIQNMGVLCIDEVESVFNGFDSAEIFTYYGKTQAFNELTRCIKESEQVVIADADATESTIQWICDVKGVDRDRDVLIITGDSKEKNYKTVVEYYDRAPINNFIKDIESDLQRGKKLAIFVTDANMGARINEAIKDKFKGEIHASAKKVKGASDKKTAKLMEDPSQHTLGLDYIIYNSKINTGVSIEHNTPYFTKCYALLNDSTLSPQSCVQGLRRVRYIKEYDIRVYLTANMKYAPKPPKAGTDLNSTLDHIQAQRKEDRAYFAPLFETLLCEYGFKPNFKAGKAQGKIHSFKPEDIQQILNAKPITKPHQQINSDRERYELARYECCNLFQTIRLNEDIVKAYIETPITPIIFNRLNNKQDIPEDETEAYDKAVEIFSRILNSKIRPEECSHIMEMVRSNERLLARAHLLPIRWMDRGVPKKSGTGSLATLAQWWGLSATVDKANSTRSPIQIELNPIYANIAIPQITCLDDARTSKIDERDRKVMILKEQGLSLRKIVEKLKIAEKLEISKSQVAKIVQKMTVHSTTENDINIILNDENCNKVDTFPVSNNVDSENVGAIPEPGIIGRSRIGRCRIVANDYSINKHIEIQAQATFEGTRPEPFNHYADVSPPPKEITIKYDPACQYALKALSAYGSYKGRIQAEIETETRVSFLSRKASNDPIYLDEWVAGMMGTHEGIKQIKFKMSSDDWPETIKLLVA